MKAVMDSYIHNINSELNKESTISSADLDAALERLNEIMIRHNRDLYFAKEELGLNKHILVTEIVSGKVIKNLAPEEPIIFLRNIDMMGLII
jgi:uncharacterized FlaG/YvyC family protein